MSRILKRELFSSWLSRLGTLLSMRGFQAVQAGGGLRRIRRSAPARPQGTVIVAHGKSNELAILNCIRMAATTVRNKAHEHLSEGLAAHAGLTNDSAKSAA